MIVVEYLAKNLKLFIHIFSYIFLI